MTGPGQASGSRAPMAVCPSDGEPLVASFVPQTEWLCMVCGARLAYFAPAAAAPSPELDARYKELLERYRAGERP